MRRDLIIDIVFIVVILSFFYLFYLGSYPLFTPDEGRYSEVAREMVATGDYITPRINGVAFLDKPILYYWLQAIAIKLFGVKEWALRLFPVLFGIFGCVITYLAGRQLFNRRTGLISATILATAPLYFGSAHYANLDLEVAVLISSTLLCFITAIHSKNPIRTRLLYAVYIFSALAFLTKGMIGIAFPVMVIGVWIALVNRWEIIKKLHLIIGLILFFALVTPWYVFVQSMNPEFLHYFFVTQQVTRFLSAAEFNNKTPFWFYVPIVAIGFFPWTIFLVQALKKQLREIWLARHQYQTELFLFLWFLIIFVFFSIPRSKTIGYILPIFPALALLVGNYLSRVWENVDKKDMRIVIISFALIGVLLAAFLITLPYFHWIDFAPGFVPYLITIAIIFILSAVISFLFLQNKTPVHLFILCTVCSAFFLLTLTLGAPQLNQNSAKPLVEDLKTIIKPEDEVITYFKYYQDLPLYLGKRITIVTDWDSPEIARKDNWVRELSTGRAFQKTDDWLINEEKFWERWNSDKRVFVFVNENYFEQFKSHAQSYFFLGKYNDIILLSNKPTIIESAVKHSWQALTKNP